MEENWVRLLVILWIWLVISGDAHWTTASWSVTIYPEMGHLFWSWYLLLRSAFMCKYLSYTVHPYCLQTVKWFTLAAYSCILSPPLLLHITHTYRQDPLGLRNGPVMWPQRCGSPHVSPPYKARQGMHLELQLTSTLSESIISHPLLIFSYTKLTHEAYSFLMSHYCSSLVITLIDRAHILPSFKSLCRIFCLSMQKSLKSYGSLQFLHSWIIVRSAFQIFTHAHMHTTVLHPSWILSETTQVIWHQKGKTRKVKAICIYWSKR